MDFKLEEIADQELELLNKIWPMKKSAKLEWRSYRTTAGMANYQNQLITLSQLVLVDQAKLISTLRHEFAHLLAFDRHGLKGKGHGAAWQKAMRDLGLEPKVTHNYEVKRNIARQALTYQCERCKATFERKRRLTEKRNYIHRDCGGKVKLLKIESAIILKEKS